MILILLVQPEGKVNFLLVYSTGDLPIENFSMKTREQQKSQGQLHISPTPMENHRD